MSKNKHLTNADLFHNHLLCLLSNRLYEENDVEYLQAVKEMAASNAESTAFDIEALGQLLAHHIGSEDGDVSLDPGIGWMFNHLGQYVQAYLSVESSAVHRLSKLKEGE